METGQIGGAVEKATADAIGDLLSRLYTGAVDRKSELVDRARLKFKAGFKEYLDQTIERCSRVKTIINRSESVALKTIHVPLQFSLAGKIYSESAIVDRICNGDKVVVTGMAGSGKSMSLKNMYLTLAEGGRVLPIYAELRHVGEYDGSMAEYLSAQVGSFAGGFTISGLIYGLRNRLLVLILDGFDEVSTDQKQRVEKELLELIHEAPRAGILISGRPHRRYEAWPVSEAHVEELTKGQVEELISRLTYDQGAKDRFIKRVGTDLFVSHRQLLANPLLCSMMLLTFDEFSEIPSKMHIFYRKAFEVLYRKHDSLKPNYSREFFTRFGEDEFTRVFETFCYLSFADGHLSFDVAGLAESYAKEALEYEGLPVESSVLYVDDLIQNVCVLLKEGDLTSYLHRSFQEYFTAGFVVGRGHLDIVELVSGLGQVYFDQQVLSFMMEMNREVVERGYILPVAKELIQALEDKRNDPAAAMRLIFNGFSYDPQEVDHDKFGSYIEISDKIAPLAAKFMSVEKLWGKEVIPWRPEGDIKEQATAIAEKAGRGRGSRYIRPTSRIFGTLSELIRLDRRAVDALNSIVAEIEDREATRAKVKERSDRARKALRGRR